MFSSVYLSPHHREEGTDVYLKWCFARDFAYSVFTSHTFERFYSYFRTEEARLPEAK